jgi:hypothetical protein
MTFQERLLAAMEKGNLRTADLARWFGRRHSTVRGWTVDGREPAGTGQDVRNLFNRLVELEGIIRRNSPVHKSARARIAEMTK